jgi:alpha-glucosidase (family GH31 glycosyl hydrolase)
MKKKLLLSIVIVLSINSVKAQNPPVTPAWAFRHIVWEDNINTSKGALSLVNQYMEHDIPVGGIIIDSPWCTAYNDFNWDTQRYPDSKEMIDYLKSKDIKVILWLTGIVNKTSVDCPVQKNASYDDVVAKGYGINDNDPNKWWKGDGVHIDFTNPKAVQWWYTQLDKAFTDGVYGWKVDQGEEYFGKTVKTSIGQLTNAAFRPYYYDAMYDYTLKKNPAGIVLARPFSHQGGFFGSVGKTQLGWCGDFSGNWKGLKLQIDNIYKSAEAGYGAPGCEVAGFWEEKSTMQQFIRYGQFGAMTACMINGGMNGAFTNHLPWYHGKETETIYRFCVEFHNQLIPYLFSTVVDTHLNGGSLIRNMSYEQESHQVGDFLFTKAITSDSNSVEFALPKDGQWIDFWDGKEYDGAAVVKQEYPLERFPLFVKSGAIIPLKIDNAVTGIGDASMSGKEVILIYPSGQNSCTYHSPAGEGIVYEDINVAYDTDKSTISVDAKTPRKFALMLRGLLPVKDVQNASQWSYNQERKELRIAAEGKSIRLTIVME